MKPFFLYKVRDMFLIDERMLSRYWSLKDFIYDHVLNSKLACDKYAPKRYHYAICRLP